MWDGPTGGHWKHSVKCSVSKSIIDGIDIFEYSDNLLESSDTVLLGHSKGL